MGDAAAIAVMLLYCIAVGDDAIPFGAAASFAAPFTGIPVFKGEHPYTRLVWAAVGAGLGVVVIVMPQAGVVAASACEVIHHRQLQLALVFRQIDG